MKDGDQLTLALPELRAKRQRRKGMPPAPERRLQIALANFVRDYINKDWKYTHLPMGEYRTPATAALLKRMGVTPGWPDFLFIGPQCSMFFLELKRAGSGRLSDKQLDMRQHLIRCGFPYLCTTSFDEAVATLQDCMILSRNIRVQ